MSSCGLPFGSRCSGSTPGMTRSSSTARSSKRWSPATCRGRSKRRASTYGIRCATWPGSSASTKSGASGSRCRSGRRAGASCSTGEISLRDFDFPGRSAVHACNGMAATSHPLATGVAVDVLRNGGSALDAAIAASATLAVVEPQSTGIGGDCFALLCLGGKGEVLGFNGSGRAPAAADLDFFLGQGLREIGATSVHAVTLPGAIDAWTRLHEAHGRLEFARLLAPAVAYARDGYPVHARVRYDWLRAADPLRQNGAARAVFLPEGEVPEEGDLHRQPALAETLAKVAAGGRRAFYEGEIAAAM